MRPAALQAETSRPARRRCVAARSTCGDISAVIGAIASVRQVRRSNTERRRGRHVPCVRDDELAYLPYDFFDTWRTEP